MRTAMRVLASRFFGLFRREPFDHAMDEEFQSHLEMLADRFVSQGMTKREALVAAKRQFGGVTHIQEELRERSSLPFLESLWADARYALRQMRKSPAFAATAVLTLALGIGANTAIFSLIDAVMLRFLPVEKPQELVLVQRQYAGRQPSNSFTNPIWEALRDQQDIFSGVLAWDFTRFDLAKGGAVQYVNGVFASGNYFATLGVRPAAGRLISAADDQRGCAALAVLSYGFWQSHFGGAESVLGSTLTLNGQPFQVIGVSAPGFYGVDVGSKFDVAIPVCSAASFDGKQSRLDQRSYWWLSVVGRLKPGITAEQSKARLAVLSPSVMKAALPTDWDAKDQQRFLKAALVVSPAGTGISYLRRDFGQPLTIVMAIVGVVLLIACANIASLLLARASGRVKEIAIRKAMGASRSRLMQQLLTESLLLSLLGAGLGLLLAHWGSALLVRNLSTWRNRVFLDLAPDTRILAFTAAIAVFTGIIVGLLPALRSTRISLITAMKGGQLADVEHHQRFRASKWIVGSQVALSLVLLIGGGLLLRSFVNLLSLDIGFDRSNVLLVRTNLDVANVPMAARPATYEDIDSRLRALPGVVSVARSLITPLSRQEWDQTIRAESPNAPTGEQSDAWLNSVTPGYFGTLRTPLLAGRDFDDRDTKTSLAVAVVNQTFARKFFPGADALGKRFRLENSSLQPGEPIEIVGMVRDSKYDSLRDDTLPTAFFPATQIREGMSGTYELRTSLPPSAVVPEVQQAVAGVNKEIPLEFNTLAEQVDANLVQERLLAELSGFFGGLALLLAMVGLYGVLSYLVAQRQTEFGIRIALGAQPSSILRLVMKDTFVVLASGIIVGVGLSLATARLLQKMLFGLSPHDLTTTLIAIGVLAAVGLLAGFLPARRATRVDPMVALRYE